MYWMRCWRWPCRSSAGRMRWRECDGKGAVAAALREGTLVLSRHWRNFSGRPSCHGMSSRHHPVQHHPLLGGFKLAVYFSLGVSRGGGCFSARGSGRRDRGCTASCGENSFVRRAARKYERAVQVVIEVHVQHHSNGYGSVVDRGDSGCFGARTCCCAGFVKDQLRKTSGTGIPPTREPTRGLSCPLQRARINPIPHLHKARHAEHRRKDCPSDCIV